MKILNLYAGIGGNRKLWGNKHKITAVEIDPKIAEVYQNFFPNDVVVVADAHDYLKDNYTKFDFIWSSPPCQTHGQYRYNVGVKAKGYKAVYPDMSLYSEIVFLTHYFHGYFVVENTKPFYKPLIKPSVVLQRHYIWSNFYIEEKKFKTKHIRSKNKISDYNDLFDISDSNIKNKRQVLRNCVEPKLGKHILKHVPLNNEKDKKEFAKGGIIKLKEQKINLFDCPPLMIPISLYNKFLKRNRI